MWRNGTPRTTSPAVTTTSTATGRRITARARPYQNPSSTSFGRWRNSDSRSIRRPSTASSAGRTTRAPTAAVATTPTPA